MCIIKENMSNLQGVFRCLMLGVCHSGACYPLPRVEGQHVLNNIKEVLTVTRLRQTIQIFYVIVIVKRILTL